MIPKLCPQFIAGIQRRAANDRDPVYFKLPPRASSRLEGRAPGSQTPNNAATRPSNVAGSNQITPNPANENSLVTVREAGQMLRCCKTTVNTLINAGQLERVKVRRATRITLRSIRAITGGL